MKIKQDFVTNSSSTSFLISAVKDEPLTATIKVDLGQYVTESITTEEQLRKWCLDEYREDEFEGLLKELEQGRTLYVLEALSDGEDAVERMLCETGLNDTGLSDNIKIIFEEGGY